jgi:hypothetical protein
MPVSATGVIAVEYVRPAFGADAYCIQRRPVLGVERVPTRVAGSRIGSRAIAVVRSARPAVGGTEGLVILRVAAGFGRLRRCRVGVTARSAMMKTQFRSGFAWLVGVIVRPV